ncbi:membrane protein [Streptomyces rubellomurinus subsp. indigoferus]|uniref:Membrane protein n=1 Tax=Streptomyces rubellomurinus (strain ATCC 31215) TaxID=359131 RepID=A0A0F2T9Q0_STRR3|nr:stage II sporulation protein M [Streptomyces rubellomurinus]KJS54615.1 membrane protein [Streptomyces rubellomurinus subsp. indigoferus]KJS59156.1 membrane protein [Streptomyces rubellomurinus]
MDLDVFVATHQGEWARLDALAGRYRLSGEEADELVTLYQRATGHLAKVQATAPDPALIGRLTGLVSRARSAVTGARTNAWQDVARYYTVSFPAALYRSRRWWVPIAVISLIGTVLIAWWVGTHPEVRNSLIAPDALREMTRPGGKYEAYYSDRPASSFAAQVWTNNAWVAVQCLLYGIALVPVIVVLWGNVFSLGLGIGLMASAGRLDIFLGLLIPHGLLELTAVFVSGGLGLRLGWTIIDPGPRTRGVALAEQGRAIIGMAIGLATVLAVSGILEAFVTPSGLPTWARISIGALAEVAFLLYALVLGRKAAAGGEVGDLAEADRADLQPVAA